MIKFIDISNHQWKAGLTDVSPLLSSVEAVVVKATGGRSFVDEACDRYVQQLIAKGARWGFYHFADDDWQHADPVMEANWFIDNCQNYFGHGVPVLDWEVTSWNADSVNAFVRRVHDVTGIWPWIYANPWRFNQGGVESNCMRWVASYPEYQHPTFEVAEGWDCPTADGVVGAWQFCSDGRLPGYDGNLDLDLFYGDGNAWDRYAGSSGTTVDGGDGWKVTESSDDRIVIER